jgi:hypothetical protein
MNRRVRDCAVATLGGLGLLLAGPVAAQLRAGSPVVIQRTRSVAAGSATITIRTETPRPGVTDTRITVRPEAPGPRASNVLVGAPTLATMPIGARTIRVLVESNGVAPAPVETRVTVTDVSRASRTLGGPRPIETLGTARGPRQTVTITGGGAADPGVLIVVE